MQFFHDVSLPGTGDIIRAFRDERRGLLAVASNFRLLTEPRARAAYGGHRLRHRLSLYRPPSVTPLGVIDSTICPMHYPINDVAFHPSRPLMAIGGGSYDGGYSFEGMLLLWDWQSGKATYVIDGLPEVKRVRFVEDGALEVFLTPWTEEDGDPAVADAFDAYYRITIPLETALAGNMKLDDIRARMGAESPRPGTGWPGVEFPEAAVLSQQVKAQETVKAAFGFAELCRRGPIWDIAALGQGRVGVVHNDCHLEIARRDGTVALITGKEGCGVQIYAAPVPMVHVGTFLWRNNVPDTITKATLCRIAGETLHPIVSYDGAYTFSVSQDGLVLGRGGRSFNRKSSRKKTVDVIINPATGAETRRNLGHFDVFNHYLRIDNAPYLFFVQGTPPDNYARKYLCSVAADGTVRRHWPILADDGDKPNSANHPMECSFAYLRDKAGEGIVAAGRHYTGRMECGGFFYRRDLPSGREAWRHATRASPTAIKCVPGSDVVLASFLDGGLWAVRSDTGKILYKEMFATGSHANVIFSFDVDTTHFYFGLLDGRYGMMPLADLGL